MGRDSVRISRGFSESSSERYKGAEKFEELRNQSKMEPGLVIRTYSYGHMIDPHYVVTRKGLRRINEDDTAGQSTAYHKPEEVLSTKAAPQGWSVVDYNPDSLDEDEVRELFGQ